LTFYEIVNQAVLKIGGGEYQYFKFMGDDDASFLFFHLNNTAQSLLAPFFQNLRSGSLGFWFSRGSVCVEKGRGGNSEVEM